ncbi:MAG: NADH-quinone oxidoreductase subunit N [Pseudomonadota bacterium]
MPINLSWVVHNGKSLAAYLPELVLLGTSLICLLLGPFSSLSRKGPVLVGAAALTVFTVLSGALAGAPVQILFSGAIALDPFAAFFKVFFGIVGLVTLAMVYRADEFKEVNLAEVTAFILALVVSLSMMAAADDILMMYLALEMVSVLSYIMVGYKKHNRASSEAGLKYILYGAFSSGVMVFGLSYLFGLTGSTDLPSIASHFAGLKGVSEAPVLFFALLLIMTGFGYKIATFPTQMWCPDVYEGAAVPITAFLSVGPKAAGFAMTLRFLFTTFGLRDGSGVHIYEAINWQLVLGLIAAVTMTFGNLAALPQRNLKRLMAYSSIGHAGYLLMGLSAQTAQGVQAVLFYLVTYLLMNFGVFLVILLVGNHLHTEELDGYRGLGWRTPFLAASLTVFLFSLTGLPPFAGFVGKYFLFAAVIQQGNYWLAALAAVNTVISLFYYARIIRAIWLETPLNPAHVAVSAGAVLFTTLLSAPTLLLGVYWTPLLRWTEHSLLGL